MSTDHIRQGKNNNKLTKKQESPSTSKWPQQINHRIEALVSKFPKGENSFIHSFIHSFIRFFKIRPNLFHPTKDARFGQTSNMQHSMEAPLFDFRLQAAQADGVREA